MLRKVAVPSSVSVSQKAECLEGAEGTQAQRWARDHFFPSFIFFKKFHFAFVCLFVFGRNTAVNSKEYRVA